MRNRTADSLAGMICVVAGVLIAALPHFIALARTGRPYYVASIDDRFYLAVASQSYFNHPLRVADPVFVSGGLSVYRSLQFLPGIWGAKLLGLDPLEIGLIWRVFAGATVGLGWYVLFRQQLKRPWFAAPLAILLLGDTGLTHGLPLVRLGIDALKIASERTKRIFRGDTGFIWNGGA